VADQVFFTEVFDLDDGGTHKSRWKIDDRRWKMQVLRKRGISC
jgi:hypothetical protein